MFSWQKDCDWLKIVTVDHIKLQAVLKLLLFSWQKGLPWHDCDWLKIVTVDHIKLEAVLKLLLFLDKKDCLDMIVID